MKTIVPRFDLWLEVEIGEKDDPANRPTENFCNVAVECEDGRRYALNVWTFDFLPIARFDWPYDPRQDEPAKYLLPPDLFVERLDRESFEEIFTQLFKNGEMKDKWISLQKEDDA
jgi:hypothetical protein